MRLCVLACQLLGVTIRPSMREKARASSRLAIYGSCMLSCSGAKTATAASSLCNCLHRRDGSAFCG